MPEHEPKPGRRAFVCDHKDHQGVPVRRFAGAGEPEPTCSKHGRMKRQQNKPYMGKEIPEVVNG